MSISSEIARLSSNISAAKTAIASKGVTVPVDANSDDLASLISQIQTGETSRAIVNMSWNGTSGSADKTYDEIKEIVDGTYSSLGSMELGSSILNVYVFGLAQLTGQTSVYGTSTFSAALYDLNTTAKKAQFLVTPSIILTVDEYGAVNKIDIPTPTVNYDTTTHVLSLS